MKKPKILVTGGGAPGFASIVNCLKISKKYNFKIYATSWKETIKPKHLTENYKVIGNNKNSGWAKELLDFAADSGTKSILPIRTDDQIPIVRNLKKFHDAGIFPTVVTTSKKLMEVCVNKFKLYEYIRNILRIPILDYKFVNSYEDFVSGLEYFGYDNLEAVCVKPAHATGSRGFRIFQKGYDYQHDYKMNRAGGAYMRPEHFLEMFEGTIFPELIMTEYLPGEEITVDTLCYNGGVKAIVPRFRNKIRCGITQRGIVDEIDKITKNMIVKIIQGLGLSYNVGLQFKEGKHGKFQLLEMNPRLQGTTILSVAAGVNIPEAMYEMSQGIYDMSQICEIKYETELERITDEIFSYEGKTFKLGDEDENEIDMSRLR